MIKKLIEEALVAHGFVSELQGHFTSFYVRESDTAIRFAVLHILDELSDPAEINNRINRLAPESFLMNSSFKKNCDLICIYRLSELTDFMNHEEEIFAIEEDPHYYKKYVLYYSEAEENELKNFNYDELSFLVANKDEFLAYKERPLLATQYSFAARTFIKIPFLELPSHQGNLTPLRLQAAKAVEEIGLTDLYLNIQKFKDENKNIENIIEEMIRDELENIQD